MMVEEKKLKLLHESHTCQFKDIPQVPPCCVYVSSPAPARPLNLHGDRRSQTPRITQGTIPSPTVANGPVPIPRTTQTNRGLGDFADHRSLLEPGARRFEDAQGRRLERIVHHSSTNFPVLIQHLISSRATPVTQIPRACEPVSPTRARPAGAAFRSTRAARYIISPSRFSLFGSSTFFMVLRKPPPPRLENLNKWNARPVTPASPSSASSSHRQARLTRAPSEDSIYSPDLNTSPAFDLMPLEEAQRSPVGSPTSHPPNSWPENVGDRANTDHSVPFEGSSYPDGPDHKKEWLPRHWWQVGKIQWRVLSNGPPENPSPRWGRPTESGQNLGDQNQWADSHSYTTTSSDPLSQTEGYIPMTARLSLLDSSEHESPWADRGNPHSQAPHSFTNETPPPVPSPWADSEPHLESQHSHSLNPPSEISPWGSQHSIKISAPQEIFLQGGQFNPYAPAVVVQPSGDPDENAYGLRPSDNPGRLGSDAGINTPSMMSYATSATSHELIDLDAPSATGMETGSQQVPSSGYSPHTHDTKSAKSLLDTQETPAQSSPFASNDNAQDQAPPVESIKLSPAEAARQQEQRAETYSIRQINWQDKMGTLIQAPILIQNKNGPCPLLALINALVLRADPKAQSPIVRSLRTREQISLGLLIEALFEELTTCLGPDEEFPDIEALTQFLTMLHTGMNVNPRLVLESVDSLGKFMQTGDLRLYSTFGVPLVHGWLASWSSPVHTAMTRTAQYHEDIQLLPFKKQELEDRVIRGDSLGFEEDQKMADIQAIQEFVDIENATQLSPFGLTQLTTQLSPGSVSILFRNDHFSTLYKHPQSHQLYSLVTDAGYANHAEVVWESLVDVTGFNSEFLSGDFRAVGHGPSGSEGPTSPTGPVGPRTSSVAASGTSGAEQSTQGPLSAQEQSDADYAYALSLQFQEEEQRERTGNQQTANRDSTSNDSVPAPTSGRSARTSNPPNRTSTTGLRPRQTNNEVDPDDPNAPPPPYEQTASGPHPRYSPATRRTPPSQPQSQFDDFDQYTSNNRYTRNRYSQQPVNVNRYSTDRGRNKDCIMM
ncbi:hypothetical protein N7462_003256 [Penicillium macrosclerotiorum]|uniref:uncharacterized protein n=1 Tax=Penicillium macrosclerotiorum TaxID=303699 RepID=UPI00254958C6|nr:uncharacterized protein N7462_003256 [Penicillium macrosclerotiorum]KAJ5688864.1 hypothetical protein N7462_003256 [Penicillium macrosclerotiorum]